MPAPWCPSISNKFTIVHYRHAEDRAGQIVFEAGHQRRDVSAQRHAVEPDRRTRLLQSYPRQQPPDVPHRLARGVHIVEHVLTRPRRAVGQPAPAGTVHRQDGQDDVQAEILVQVPGAEEPEIDWGPAHCAAVYAHEPGSRLAVTQHQRVLAIVPGIAQPPFRAWFTRIRRIAAVEADPFVGASAILFVTHRDVGQRWG